MNRGILLVFLLIIAAVSVEGGLGSKLKDHVKSIGKPFEKGAKQGAEVAAAAAVAKAVAAVMGRRKRSEDERSYKNLEESSLTEWKQWDDKY
ncbi:hypothetical protein RB195_015076 [Necator americanus]